MGALAVVMGCPCLFILWDQDTSLPAYYNRTHPKLALSLILGVTGFRERSSPILSPVQKNHCPPQRKSGN